MRIINHLKLLAWNLWTLLFKKTTQHKESSESKNELTEITKADWRDLGYYYEIDELKKTGF